MPGSCFYPSAELERPLSLKQDQFKRRPRDGTQKRRRLGGGVQKGPAWVVLSAVRAAPSVGGQGEKEPPASSRFRCPVLGTRAWCGGCTRSVSLTGTSFRAAIRSVCKDMKQPYVQQKKCSPSAGKTECFTETRQRRSESAEGQTTVMSSV